MEEKEEGMNGEKKRVGKGVKLKRGNEEEKIVESKKQMRSEREDNDDEGEGEGNELAAQCKLLSNRVCFLVYVCWQYVDLFAIHLCENEGQYSRRVFSWLSVRSFICRVLSKTQCGMQTLQNRIC
jgi:hypothetical protein